MYTTEYAVGYTEAIILIVLISFITWKLFSQRNIPPGPWGLPLVGYIPYMGEKPELTLTKLGKKYGNIFSLQLGSRLVVVLNDYAVIKEAFVKQGMAFMARPAGIALAINDDEKGIGLERGISYIQHRRFLLSTLRDFGMGKTDLEPTVNDEIRNLLDVIAGFNGKPMNPHRILTLSTVNIICAMTLGKRFEYSDPMLETLLQLPGRFIEISGSLAIRQYFPFLRHVPFSNAITKQDTLEEITNIYDKINMDIIKQHQNNPNEDIHDYIDAYLAKRNEIIAQFGDEGPFDLEFLAGTLKVLFIGGAETVATTLLWGMMYLISNPSIQAKVQAEIDAVIGAERAPSVTDQPQMNFTRATIMEIARCASVTPLGLLRSNVEEVTVFGYRIPKETCIISNLWAVHHDESLWEDPDSFMPERFLDEKGILKRCDYLIPFCIGKRSCVGEYIAKMQLFLFFTSLFQRFTLQPENYDPKTFKHKSGIARVPDPFTIRAVQRDNFRVGGE